MKTSLTERLEEASFFLEKEKHEVLIFGSAAITLHGVDLQRDINDLDIFASDLVFNRLGARFTIQTKPGNEGEEVFFILVGTTNIEVLKTFPGVDFVGSFRRGIVLPSSNGFKVGALPDLLEWKHAQNRPKDVKDADAIRRHR